MDEPAESLSPEVSQRYGHNTDILAYIFQNNLLSTKALVNSKIIIESIMFVWHYKEFKKAMKNKGYLEYEYLFMKSMVEHWSVSFEKDCRQVELTMGEKLTRDNIVDKLAFYVRKCYDE